MNEKMNGAQSLARTLVNCGVDVCFANPGTSEMHFVAALDSAPEMRAGVLPVRRRRDRCGRRLWPCRRQTRRDPAPSRPRAGQRPGQSAQRAPRQTPIVNVVGDHATYHLQYDALLTSDIVGFARPVSAWIHEVQERQDRGRRCRPRRAGRALRTRWRGHADPAGRYRVEPGRAMPPRCCPTSGRRRSASRCDRRYRQTAEPTARRARCCCAARRLHGAGLEAAGRVQARTGARLFCDTFAPHAEFGAGRVPVERIPYFAEQIVAFLQGIEQIVLVGSKPPVSFFAYPGKPSWCCSRELRVQPSGAPARRRRPARCRIWPMHWARRPSQPCAFRSSCPDMPSGALNALSVAQSSRN
jgi:acetolactate synthase-1/2/3 large subunit